MDRRLALALRLLGAVVMLTLLVRRVHLASLFPTWTAATAGWIGAGLALTGLGVVLATWRWSRVLHALEVRLPFRTLLSTYLAGLFVGNFLPSTIGGDVLRIRRLSARTNGGTAPFTSIVLERLTGWMVLPVIALGALIANPGLRALGRASHVALGVSVATMAGLALVTLAAASVRIGGRLAGHESWLRFLGAVHLGIDRFRRSPADTVAALTAAAVYQLVAVLTAYVAARSLGVSLSPTAALAFVPVVAIVQVLPVTLGGLGVREGAFALFLSPLGVPTGRAVALGLLLYGCNLAVSLCGAPAFAMGAHSPRGRRVADPTGSGARR